MRMKLYHSLVNKHSGICQRYHKMHDGTGKVRHILSWFYLIWLNIAYTVFRCHWLAEAEDATIYEEKNICTNRSESEKELISPKEFAKKLSKYSIVSFDVFDTLLYRPFSEPTDLFFLIGMELKIMDFKKIRMEAEQEARQCNYTKASTYEVTLEEIWNLMEEKTGIPAKQGMLLECEYEEKVCYANPYMKEVFDYVKKNGQRIIFTTDMYLPSNVILSLLKKNGYEGETLFLSCEQGKNKGTGALFQYVKQTLGETLTYAHVGDNETSDIQQAKKNGFDSYYIPNPNKFSKKYRCYDLSPIIGGAYRGIVNNRIYNRNHSYGMNYEYGFIYGGLFAVGYCHFIHEYCEKNHVDKIFFLARDGEILQKVYAKLYPKEKTEYVYWSRLAAAKLSAKYFKYDYVRKFVLHKVNQGFSFHHILQSMELEALISYLSMEHLDENTLLTSQNVKIFTAFLSKYWETILSIYEPQRTAAKRYFKEKAGNSHHIAAIDIGWAGSGALALNALFQKEWNMNCKVTGIIAGTNTIHNAEPEMSEGFLLSGELVSYLYASNENRDLWKKHNPASGYNLYWELLTSSPTPSFQGFYPQATSEEPLLRFRKPEKNSKGIEEIQQGILDFTNDYITHFKQFPQMFHISGRDAYAPMLLAASERERYLKQIYENFELEIKVGD